MAMLRIYWPRNEPTLRYGKVTKLIRTFKFTTSNDFWFNFSSTIDFTFVTNPSSHVLLACLISRMRSATIEKNALRSYLIIDTSLQRNCKHNRSNLLANIYLITFPVDNLKRYYIYTVPASLSCYPVRILFRSAL